RICSNNFFKDRAKQSLIVNGRLNPLTRYDLFRKLACGKSLIEDLFRLLTSYTLLIEKIEQVSNGLRGKRAILDGYSIGIKQTNNFAENPIASNLSTCLGVRSRRYSNNLLKVITNRFILCHDIGILLRDSVCGLIT